MLSFIQNKHIKFKKNKLGFDDLCAFYTGNSDNLIGLEYERLSLDKSSLENASYEKLEKIVLSFCEKSSWQPIYDSNILIGANCTNGSSISLEPGCQLEISLSPKKELVEIESELFKIISELDKIAALEDVIFLGYGISPKSNVDDIKLLNKRRYKIMNNYLPSCSHAELIPKMMRQSAGIQVNIDYKDNADACNKLKFFNLIMPFLSALTSNSPFENGSLSDKKSVRGYVWQYCGKQRCNLFYKSIFKKFFAKKNVIKNYISCVNDIPMLFIERDNEIIEINGNITFKEFLKNGFLGHQATLQDYILHQSLCFPDVRLKNYIEIRNHDSSTPQIALALCALYKGLCSCDIQTLLNDFKYLKVDEVENNYKKATKFGLDFLLNNNMKAWDVVRQIINCAKSKLSLSEIKYLEPILDMLSGKKTQADLLIDSKIKNASSLVEVCC